MKLPDDMTWKDLVISFLISLAATAIVTTIARHFHLLKP